MSEIVEVTQDDRDAAGELWADLSMDEPHANDGYAAMVLEMMATAFARHRIAAEARSYDGEWEAMRERCAKVADKMAEAASKRLETSHDDDAAAQLDTATEIAAAIRGQRPCIVDMRSTIAREI